MRAAVRSFGFAAALAASLAATGVSGQREVTVPKPDLADAAAGVYRGDVISDSRGSSRSDVTITISKTGPNTVQVASSYDRLPTVSSKIARVMDTVQGTGTPTGPLEVFLLDTSKSPLRLDLTIDGASWSGEKAG
ncbi:MAG TPA: hypothetical protein VI168_07010 [Croceibacterium sp.]